MKKLICTLFALVMCASLAACGGSDEPAETTDSKDEQAVATTTGSAAHEHTWVDATCQAPKTCSECGGTEGEIGTHSYENKVCSVCGEKQTSEGLQFMLNDAGDGYSVIGIGSCLDTDIVIPATYEGKPVTEVGEVAFRDCATITSVTIPDGVTVIAESAFSGCIRLKSVTIPESAKMIGEDAFSDCEKITAVYISDLKAWCEIDIEGETFWTNESSPMWHGAELYLNNEPVTDLIIPDGTTRICESAFNKCTSLTSITIPDSVTSIGQCAFDGCTNLTSVTIGKGVTRIGTRAFGNCEKIAEVHINDIEAWCKIKFAGGFDEAYDAYGSNNPLQYGATLYLNGTEVTNVVFPDSITSVDKGTLYGLDTITLNQSLANPGIQYGYFGTVKHIIIPDGVTSIGEWAFVGCPQGLSIYCEAESKPESWQDNWNGESTVYWGGEWEYVDGVPTVK